MSPEKKICERIGDSARALWTTLKRSTAKSYRESESATPVTEIAFRMALDGQRDNIPASDQCDDVFGAQLGVPSRATSQSGDREDSTLNQSRPPLRERQSCPIAPRSCGTLDVSHWRRPVKAAGISGLVFNGLRQTAPSWLAGNGATEQQLRAIGEWNSNVVSRYVRRRKTGGDDFSGCENDVNAAQCGGKLLHRSSRFAELRGPACKRLKSARVRRIV